jgi:Zn-dependent protease
MAAAGPAANFILFALAFTILKIGLISGLWTVPAEDRWIDRLVTAAPGASGLVDAAGRFLSVVLGLNLILGLFNLLPVPPLDGASVLSGVAPAVRAFYRSWSAIPAAGIVGIILAWRVSPYVVMPVLEAAARALWSG